MNLQQINRSLSVSRRRVLGVTAAVMALPLAGRTADAAVAEPQFDSNNIKALTFDVQGTLVDYWQPFIRIGTALGARKGLRLDWANLLGDWNAGAASIIQAINTGTQPWIPADSLFRMALDNVLTARALSNQFDDTDRLELMSVWNQMAAWPDSANGIERLRRRFTVATLSNAGMASIIMLAKRTGMPFDAVLSGELMHAYKPSPEVYRAASTYLGLPPHQIMMVAAHKIDLKAAKAAGLRTAYIPRPLELGPTTKVDRFKDSFIDIVADDVVHLSEQIGAT